MYRDIGLRQHQGVMTNGHKLVEKMKEIEDAPFVGSTYPKDVAETYKRKLDELDKLFHSANQMLNFND